MQNKYIHVHFQSSIGYIVSLKACQHISQHYKNARHLRSLQWSQYYRKELNKIAVDH